MIPMKCRCAWHFLVRTGSGVQQLRFFFKFLILYWKGVRSFTIKFITSEFFGQNLLQIPTIAVPNTGLWQNILVWWYLKYQLWLANDNTFLFTENIKHRLVSFENAHNYTCNRRNKTWFEPGRNILAFSFDLKSSPAINKSVTFVYIGIRHLLYYEDITNSKTRKCYSSTFTKL